MRHMKKTTILGLGLAALLLGLPQAAHAQITVTGGLGINIAFPEPPPLVVVRPGIQVVPEYDEEVYFTNGYYWARRDDGWFRCRDWHGRDWRPVEVRYVPVGLARIPPGRFRHYYRDDDGRVLGSMQYGPASLFPRASDLPAGPPSDDAILGETIGSTALAYLILGEGLTIWKVLGGLFIFSGILVATMKRS